MKNYNIREDPEFKRIMQKHDLSKDTKNVYANTLKIFCDTNQKPYHQIVEEIKEEQYDRIDEENHRIIRYNPDTGKIQQYIENYLNHFKNNGNKPNSIKNRQNHLRTVLRKSDLILPKPQKINYPYTRKTILGKKDIQSILQTSNIHHKALISFLATTGLRIHDALNQLTIEKFIEATSEHHHYYDVDEFINYAPHDITPYWVFTPYKTRKLGLECKVCNTPETTHYLLQSLQERQRILESKGDTVELEDPLFVSRETSYKKPLNRTSVSALFWHKNKIFKQNKKEQLQKQLEEQKITYKQYKDNISNIPKFHPHGLRHFFITTIRNYTTNHDISLIMEGHASPYKMDKHYIGSNEELFSDKVIQDTYEQIIPYLTFNQEIDPVEYQELLLQKKVNEELRVEQEKQRKLLENIIKNSGIDKLL